MIFVPKIPALVVTKLFLPMPFRLLKLFVTVKTVCSVCLFSKSSKENGNRAHIQVQLFCNRLISLALLPQHQHLFFQLLGHTVNLLPNYLNGKKVGIDQYASHFSQRKKPPTYPCSRVHQRLCCFYYLVVLIIDFVNSFSVTNKRWVISITY